MEKWSVFITRYLAGDAWKRLLPFCDVTYDQDQLLPLERDALLAKMRDKDAVISAGDRIDREMIEASPKLKVIVDLWSGGGVDKEAAKEHGIQVLSHNLGFSWIHRAECEHVFMMLLAASRRLREADAFVRAGKFVEMDQANRDMLGLGLKGRTLGLIGGAGWTGPEIARVARAFEMKVLYWAYIQDEKMEQEGASFVPLETLLKESDCLALLVLRGHSGGYVLDKAQFDQMKPGMVITNVTHGHLINEAELVKAVRDGRVYGAGLDKLEKETVAADGLLDLTRVIVTPHADGALEKERSALLDAMVTICLNALGAGKEEMA